MRVRVAVHEETGGREARRLERSARRMMKILLPGERRELSVALVGEAEMRQLNNEFLGRDEPTDVLAFPLGDVNGSEDPIAGWRRRLDPLGDVVICVPLAARNALERGTGLSEELELLLAHGLIHLVGGEHETAPGASRMEALERELLGRSIIN